MGRHVQRSRRHVLLRRDAEAHQAFSVYVHFLYPVHSADGHGRDGVSNLLADQHDRCHLSACKYSGGAFPVASGVESGVDDVHLVDGELWCGVFDG
jgi:hypothetical protein